MGASVGHGSRSGVPWSQSLFLPSGLKGLERVAWLLKFKRKNKKRRLREKGGGGGVYLCGGKKRVKWKRRKRGWGPRVWWGEKAKKVREKAFVCVFFQDLFVCLYIIFDKMFVCILWTMKLTLSYFLFFPLFRKHICLGECKVVMIMLSS